MLVYSCEGTIVPVLVMVVLKLVLSLSGRYVTRGARSMYHWQTFHKSHIDGTKSSARLTSNPLFVIVALSSVIFAPMSQLGCVVAFACTALLSASHIRNNSSFVKSLNAPPDAVRIILLRPPGGTPWGGTGISPNDPSRRGAC